MQRHDRASARAALRSAAAALVAPALLALLFASLAACDKGPARECDANFLCPDPFVCDLGSSTCVDPDDGVFCTKDSSCKGDKPYCSPTTSLCVGCIEEDLTKRCTDGKVCSKDNCLRCLEDTQCFGKTTDESTLCLFTGTCAAEDQVAHVTAAGTEAADCSFLTPCTLSKALSTNRPYIRVRDDLSLTAAVTVSRTVTIHGSRSLRTQITRSTPGEIFNVSGAGTIELRNLQLADANGPAILVSSGSPKLDLDNVDVVRNSGVGISSGMAALVVQRSIIASNAAGGITAAAPVVLENNIIVRNGSPTSVFGGVQLATSDPSNVVRFNTFAGNQAMAAVGRSVSCGATTVSLSSNVFADAAPPVTMCTTTYSLFPTGAMLPGTGNKEGDPVFEDATATNLPAKVPPSRDGFKHYHIKSGSPAEESGEDLGEDVVGQDFDSEDRGADDKDIGADEI